MIHDERAPTLRSSCARRTTRWSNRSPLAAAGTIVALGIALPLATASAQTTSTTAATTSTTSLPAPTPTTIAPTTTSAAPPSTASTVRPLASQRTFTVSPTTGIRKGTRITATGTGHAPNEELFVTAWVGRPGQWTCDRQGQVPVTTDVDGDFTVTFTFSPLFDQEDWLIDVDPFPACPGERCDGIGLLEGEGVLRNLAVVEFDRPSSPGATPARPVGASPRFTG